MLWIAQHLKHRLEIIISKFTWNVKSYFSRNSHVKFNFKASLFSSKKSECSPEDNDDDYMYDNDDDHDDDDDKAAISMARP